VFYSLAFGYFMQDNPFFVSSGAAFFIASGLMLVALVIFAFIPKQPKAAIAKV